MCLIKQPRSKQIMYFAAEILNDWNEQIQNCVLTFMLVSSVMLYVSFTLPNYVSEIYKCRISEMNITGTLPPLLFMAKTWRQILRVTSPRHACLGEVSRESASRQSHELSMRSDAYDKLVFVQCEKCFFWPESK